jgi:hypothetical protein
MNDRDRLKRLRALRDQLTRLPPSADRDRMLREVGSRSVDLESSEPEVRVRPRPAKLDAPAETEPVPQRVQRAPATPRTSTRGETGRAHARAEAADAFIASVRPTPEITEGQLLSLGDEPAAAPEPGEQRPWTRGLRG